jgi:hypothetical protein
MKNFVLCDIRRHPSAALGHGKFRKQVRNHPKAMYLSRNPTHGRGGEGAQGGHIGSPQ